ncbi:MAG: hypothetical protein Q8P24_20090 [Desulfobacterales bacterium]|nr:hypothetical protein [Desulfobacterales bacterium]
MKKIITSGIVSIFMSIMVIGGALAADAVVSVDTNSAYVWRGITFNDGLVVQPSVAVSHKGFGINVWGNIDVGDYNDTLKSGEFSEVDFTLSYGFNIKGIDVSLGYIEYLFPNGAEGTKEVFGTLGYNIYKGLSASFGFYYDVDEIDSYYTNFSLGYNLPIGKKFSLNFGALAGYAGKDFAIAYGGIDGGFYEYTFSVRGNYSITKAFSIYASLLHTESFDKEVLPDQDVDFYGGAGISYTF